MKKILLGFVMCFGFISSANAKYVNDIFPNLKETFNWIEELAAKSLYLSTKSNIGIDTNECSRDVGNTFCLSATAEIEPTHWSLYKKVYVIHVTNVVFNKNKSKTYQSSCVMNFDMDKMKCENFTTNNTISFIKIYDHTGGSKWKITSDKLDELGSITSD